MLRREVRALRRTRLRTWLVALCSLVVIGQVLGARALRCFGESKLEVARQIARDYELDAYPAWLADHPGERCPPSIAELAAAGHRGETRDVWGEDYVLVCGRRGIVVISPGEDGILGTRDDVHSSD